MRHFVEVSAQLLVEFQHLFFNKRLDFVLGLNGCVVHGASYAESLVNRRLSHIALQLNQSLRVFYFNQCLSSVSLVFQQLLGQFQVQVGETLCAGQYDVGQANSLVEVVLAEGLELFVFSGEHGISFCMRDRVKSGVAASLNVTQLLNLSWVCRYRSQANHVALQHP